MKRTPLQISRTSGKSLEEIFASVPNSFSAHMDQIRTALESNPPAGVSDMEDLSIEAILSEFPSRVIVYDFMSKDRKYFAFDVSLDDDGEVEFGEVEEVEFEVVMKAKEESDAWREHSPELKKFVETLDARFEGELSEGGAKKRRGKVTISQRSETVNRNGRLYPEDVLSEAVERASERIVEHGPLYMYSMHPAAPNPTESCALINAIEMADGTVSLGDIVMVETDAGKNMGVLMEAGAKFQVSQRGMGTSHIVKDEKTGDNIEVVDWLEIQGFDFIPSGDASVNTTQFEFVEKKKKRGGPQTVGGPATTPITPKLPETAGEGSKDMDLNDEVRGAIGAAVKTAVDAFLKESVPPDVSGEVSELAERLGNTSDDVEGMSRFFEVEYLKRVGGEMLSGKLDKLERFSPSQRELIGKRVSLEDLYETIGDVRDSARIEKAVSEALRAEVVRFDETVAASSLKEIDFGKPQEGGVSHIQYLSEQVPGAEGRAKLQEAMQAEIKRNTPGGFWWMPEDHAAMKTLNSIMEDFYRANYGALAEDARVVEKFLGETYGVQRALHEAGEEVTQSDIGGRISTIAAVVIPVAWRTTTALQVVQTGTMQRRIEDHKIAVWNSLNNPTNPSADIADIQADMEVGESGTPPVVGVSYTDYPIFATKQMKKSFITLESIATARNTPMQPLVDMLAGIAVDVRDVIDRVLWWLMVTEGLNQSTTTVTSYETLTKIGSTDEYKSLNEGWCRYEWVKTSDGNGNPLTAKLLKLYPNSGASAPVAGTSLQGVDVQSDAPTAFLMDTDYTVNWPDGTITLTAAGVTKLGADNLQAKYTYSGNVKLWSKEPPDGIDLYNHMINLRSTVGAARTLVRRRNYPVNFVGMEVDLEELISSGPQFTNLGATPADILGMMNDVRLYAGATPIRTTAMPVEWMVVGQNGAAVHKVHTPWQVRGPIISETTGDDHYLAHQFSASDVPKNDKLAVIGITNINSGNNL